MVLYVQNTVHYYRRESHSRAERENHTRGDDDGWPEAFFICESEPTLAALSYGGKSSQALRSIPLVTLVLRSYASDAGRRADLEFVVIILYCWEENRVTRNLKSVLQMSTSTGIAVNRDARHIDSECFKPLHKTGMADTVT